MPSFHASRSTIEPLESRTLLSTTVPTIDPGPGPTVEPDCVTADQLAADRTAVQQDLAKLSADRQACHDLINADRAALQSAREALRAKLEPLLKKLHDDEAKCHETLAADRAAVVAAQRAGQQTILADLAALHAAGTDPAKRQAALDKLAADRKALQDTLTPLIKKAHDDQAACATLLAADRQAITDLFHNDATVQAAQDKLTKDLHDCQAKLAADAEKLHADAQKLRDDYAHRCTEDHDGDGHPETPADRSLVRLALRALTLSGH